jgi:hypothetical protein
MKKSLLALSIAALIFTGCGSSGGGDSTSDDTATVSASASASVTLAPLNQESAADLLHAVNTPIMLDMVYWDFASDEGLANLSEGNFSCDNDGSYQVVKNSDTDIVFVFNKCNYDEDYFDGTVELKCDSTECLNPTVTALSDVVTSEDGSVVEKAGFVMNINVVSDSEVKESGTGEFTNGEKLYKFENFVFDFYDAGDGATGLKVLSGNVYINNLANYVEFDKMIEDLYQPDEDSPWVKGSVAFKADGGDIVLEWSNPDVSALIDDQVVATEPQNE